MEQFLTNHEIIVAARRNAVGSTWDYICGGSETETTMRRNRQALDSIAFRPRVLCDVSHIDTASTMLGMPCRMPVFLAPMASLQLMTPAGRTAAELPPAESARPAAARRAARQAASRAQRQTRAAPRASPR